MMHDGWRAVTWGQVSELKYGKALRNYRSQSGTVEVFGTNGPVGWTDSALLAEGPRPVVGRKGAYRGVHLAKGPFWVIDTAYWLEPEPSLDPLWAYYKLLTVDINGMDSGSAIPSLTRTHFEALPLLLPPIDEQRRVAGVLGVLDDLIDTNRVLACRSQALAAALASNSPDRVPLTEFASVANVRQFRPDGPVDHFSIPAFDEGQLPERSEGESIKSAKLLLAEPTVLVSRLNPQTPRVWMAYVNDVPAAASTEFVPLVGAGSVAVEEVWAVCADDEFATQMMARVTGTTGSHQRVDKAAIPQLLVADVRKLDRRERVAIISLVREANASLVSASEAAHVRDELLPLLLSGQMRVEDVAA